MSATVNAPRSPDLVPAVATAVPAAGAVTEIGRPVFSADDPADDHLGRSASASFLARLIAHRTAGTPFLIGLFGAAGSGKSAFLRQVLDAVAATSRATESGPFLPRVVTARVEASVGAEPATAIVGKVFSALGRDYPSLAEEAIHAGADPVDAARAARERVDELRRKLDAERQLLGETEARRARLTETVLFDSPGSRVDAYARANRGRIETRLRAFGLPYADPIASYKDFVRDAASADGKASRWSLLPRAMWSFKGQGGLIILAVLLFLLAWLAGTLADNQAGAESWLSGLGDRFGGPAGWARDHLGWLLPLGRAALVLAGLALLLNLWRAFRFLQPILKGTSLLSGDLEGRRRDLDGLLTHQTRRVEHLSAEVETAVRSAENAERRAEARRGTAGSDPHLSLGASDLSPKPTLFEAAEAFFDAVSAAMRGNPAPSPTGGTLDPAALSDPPAPPAPSRIVVAIDGLDRLSGTAAAAMLETAHQLLGRPNFVTLAAAERSHLLGGLSDTDPALAWARLDRSVQLSYDLDAEPVSGEGMADHLLGGRAAPPAPSDTGMPGLDRPWQPFEHALVRMLAPFSSGTPRGLKRFVNTYRVARADPRLADATAAELGGLALALALDGGSGGAELSHLDPGGAEAGSGLSSGSELARGLAATRSAAGSDFTLAEARRGLTVAKTYGRRGQGEA